MAINVPAVTEPLFPNARAFEGRRLLALTGIIAVVGALVTAGASRFAVLVGATPIAPDNTTTLALIIGINAAFVVFLIGLIVREVHRILAARSARQGGVSAACAHRRDVFAWLRRYRRSSWRSSPRSRWISASTAGSRSARRRSSTRRCRSPRPMCWRMPAICRDTTLSMANDLDNARTLYELDRTGFRDFMSQQAVGRALAHAALIRADGSFIMSAADQPPISTCRNRRSRPFRPLPTASRC